MGLSNWLLKHSRYEIPASGDGEHVLDSRSETLRVKERASRGGLLPEGGKKTSPPSTETSPRTVLCLQPA